MKDGCTDEILAQMMLKQTRSSLLPASLVDFLSLEGNVRNVIVLLLRTVRVYSTGAQYVCVQ